MSYEYKDHEIYARVYQSGSALYEIDKEGDITEEVPGCDITHDDQTIVWYEVEAVNPKTGFTEQFVELEDIDEAKKVIDKSIKYIRRFDNE